MAKIDQVRVSRGVRFFKQGLQERWRLKDYYDINKPCLFFNINDQSDIDAVKTHKGFKLIFFANARGNDFIHHFVGVENLVVKNNPYLKIPDGIKTKNAEFEIKDYSMFQPSVLGDTIYCYVGNDKQKSKYGYEAAIKLQNQIKFKIVFGMQGNNIVDLKKKFYDPSFVNLNLELTGSGGLTTVREMAHMGRYTIMNTLISYPSIIKYKDMNELIFIINQESKKIGTLPEKIKLDMVGDEWLDENFWKKQ